MLIALLQVAIIYLYVYMYVVHSMVRVHNDTSTGFVW